MNMLIASKIQRRFFCLFVLLNKIIQLPSCVSFKYLQGRMSMAGRPWALPLWPPHSRSQVGMGCNRLSLGSAGTLQWDRVVPEQSPLDSSGPVTECKTMMTHLRHSVQQDINNSHHGFSRSDAVEETIQTMEKGRTGQGI